ncbi:MAG: gliding motility-associated ABC transporter substrate-binding protein GldG [Flavobacteriales bacterium]|nr:MAG: gliding motility-associated ABC transporter substrate-binding protein GldG [Flavobacteriales bacterium]
MKKNIISLVKALVFLILANMIAGFFPIRFDLTEDHRFTLAEPSINTVTGFNNPVIIDILLDGNLTPEFLKLQNETRQILESFASKNKNIKYSFVDPLKGVEQIDGTITELQALGLTPTRVTTSDNTKVSQEIVFPWAMVNYDNKTIRVPLLKNKLGATTEERVNSSVQHLEYAFADAFTKIALTDKKRIAVIKGNGELEDIYLADFLTSIRDYYNIGAITLDSVATDPQKVLDQLKTYDLALVAKPTQPFTDGEKYIMDQFMVNGGKSVWLIDPVAMELDSLFNERGNAMALPLDLNLNDFFFSYGARINADLVNDMYFTQIVLATGDGNEAQYNPAPWLYNPMVFSKNNHPINNNMEALRFQFTSSIDTLPNAYKKTILYQSSPLSKLDKVPRLISLDLINTPPKKDLFNNGNQPLAVLIEGKFSSAFDNRIKPLKLTHDMYKGPANKMLVIADGDIIKNQLRNGRPLELGYDKWTNSYYGNKEFLVNAFNYLLDDSGLINIRNKKVAIPFLDEVKTATQKTRWQIVNIGVPIVLTLLFGWLFNFFRKRKYGH